MAQNEAYTFDQELLDRVPIHRLTGVSRMFPGIYNRKVYFQRSPLTPLADVRFFAGWEFDELRDGVIFLKKGSKVRSLTEESDGSWTLEQQNDRLPFYSVLVEGEEEKKKTGFFTYTFREGISEREVTSVIPQITIDDPVLEGEEIIIHDETKINLEPSELSPFVTPSTKVRITVINNDVKKANEFVYEAEAWQIHAGVRITSDPTQELGFYKDEDDKIVINVSTNFKYCEIYHSWMGVSSNSINLKALL